MAAELSGPDRVPISQSTTTSLRVIDLGFGCSGQSIYLTQLPRKTATDLSRSYLLDSYVDLTAFQSQFALQRNGYNQSQIQTKAVLSCFVRMLQSPALGPRILTKLSSIPQLKKMAHLTRLSAFSHSIRSITSSHPENPFSDIPLEN